MYFQTKGASRRSKREVFFFMMYRFKTKFYSFKVSWQLNNADLVQMIVKHELGDSWSNQQAIKLQIAFGE